MGLPPSLARYEITGSGGQLDEAQAGEVREESGETHGELQRDEITHPKMVLPPIFAPKTCTESDTAGEVVGGRYGRSKRATIRPISGGMSCRF